jgi:hypothetical protein
LERIAALRSGLGIRMRGAAVRSFVAILRDMTNPKSDMQFWNGSSTSPIPVDCASRDACGDCACWQDFLSNGDRCAGCNPLHLHTVQISGKAKSLWRRCSAQLPIPTRAQTETAAGP